MNIVTPELVQEAIDLSLPTVRMLCKRDTWGPKGVVIAVFGKGLSTPVVYIMEELGARETWLDEGKPIDFEEIALQKLRGASREGRTSHSIAVDKPWLLETGDSLYRGAVAEDQGLAAAASGVHETMDETIAWIVLNIISGLCYKKVRELLTDQDIYVVP